MILLDNITAGGQYGCFRGELLGRDTSVCASETEGRSLTNQDKAHEKERRLPKTEVLGSLITNFWTQSETSLSTCCGNLFIFFSCYFIHSLACRQELNAKHLVFLAFFLHQALDAT